MGMGNQEKVVALPEPVYYTAEMVRMLGAADSSHAARFECVFGELLVSPGPSGLHQIVVSRLHTRLTGYVTRHGIAQFVFVSPADVSWGRDDVTVQPDVFTVPLDHARLLAAGAAWSVVTRLPLAIEVVSPSSRMIDRFVKRRLYQQERVATYWVVDPELRIAEVWTPEAHFPTIERERLAWLPEGASEPLTIALDELFAEP
jgi:Uma2 family endonuclease